MENKFLTCSYLLGEPSKVTNHTQRNLVQLTGPSHKVVPGEPLDMKHLLRFCLSTREACFHSRLLSGLSVHNAYLSSVTGRFHFHLFASKTPAWICPRSIKYMFCMMDYDWTYSKCCQEARKITFIDLPSFIHFHWVSLFYWWFKIIWSNLGYTKWFIIIFEAPLRANIFLILSGLF